jgi:drug/metabolite transporter (DMT)-like permease
VVVFQDNVSNIWLSVFGVVLLICGVCIIALNQPISQKLFGLSRKTSNMELSAPLARDSESKRLNEQGSFSARSSGSGSGSSLAGGTRAVGFCWAAVVGLAGGSVLAPEHYTRPEESGFAFVPSFGIGAMLASPVLTVIWFNFVEKSSPQWHVATALPVGILSGLLWNVSNIFAIMAIASIGYGVAYPIIQCALFVAGVWGVVVFKEIRGKDVLVFFSGGSVLILGAVLVAIAA